MHIVHGVGVVGYSPWHWRRLVKNIGGINPHFLWENVVKSDKCMGVVGDARAAPQSLRLWPLADSTESTGYNLQRSWICSHGNITVLYVGTHSRRSPLETDRSRKLRLQRACMVVRPCLAVRALVTSVALCWQFWKATCISPLPPSCWRWKYSNYGNVKPSTGHKENDQS